MVCVVVVALKKDTRKVLSIITKELVCLCASCSQFAHSKKEKHVEVQKLLFYFKQLRSKT